MLVKVFNHNVHPYTEVFRGRTVVIPPNDFVEMDEDEADYFMQTFTHPKKDSQDRPDPLYFKKLKLIRPPVEAKADDLVCHANGQKAATAQELATLLANFSHMAASKDESGEGEVNKRLKKENKELKSRLARIEEKLGFVETQDEANL